MDSKGENCIREYYFNVDGTKAPLDTSVVLSWLLNQEPSIEEFRTHDGQLGTPARAVQFAVRGVADGDESAAATS